MGTKVFAAELITKITVVLLIRLSNLVFMPPVLGQLKVSIFSEVWPPYSYFDEQGNPAGEMTSTIMQALQQGNIGFDFRYYPWNRAYNQALTRPNTLIYPIYRTEQREPLFYWFCSLFPTITINAITRSDTHFHAMTLQDMVTAGVVVGVMHDDNSYEKALGIGFSEDQIDTSSSDLDNVKKLAHKRIDVVLQSWDSFQFRLNKIDVPDAVTFMKGPKLYTLEPHKLCAAVNKNSDADTVFQLRTALAKVAEHP